MENDNQLIHIAFITPDEKGRKILYLRKKGPIYSWNYVDSRGNEEESPVSTDTIEEAMREAAAYWKGSDFRTLQCGFRYNLPERDEHGINALFYQMISSYNSSNGVYFDEDLGHNCYVQNASLAARKIWEDLKKAGKL